MQLSNSWLRSLEKGWYLGWPHRYKKKYYLNELSAFNNVLEVKSREVQFLVVSMAGEVDEKRVIRTAFNDLPRVISIQLARWDRLLSLQNPQEVLSRDA